MDESNAKEACPVQVRRELRGAAADGVNENNEKLNSKRIHGWKRETGLLDEDKWNNILKVLLKAE